MEREFKSVIEIADIGSDINFQKKGFIKLLSLLFNRKVSKIVATHKDRLMRFGFPLIAEVLTHLDVEIEVLRTTPNPDFAAQLTTDLVEIITVFSAKLYCQKLAQNKTTLKNLVSS